MANARTLLERLANLSNKYDSVLEDKKSVIIKSTFNVIEKFLITTRGSVLSNSEYGMYDLFKVVNLFNNEQDHPILFGYIKEKLSELDGRISKVEVSKGNVATKSSIVPYINIDVYFHNHLFNNLAPNEVVKISIGYDMLGNIYQVK